MNINGVQRFLVEALKDKELLGQSALVEVALLCNRELFDAFMAQEITRFLLASPNNPEILAVPQVKPLDPRLPINPQ